MQHSRHERGRGGAAAALVVLGAALAAASLACGLKAILCAAMRSRRLKIMDMDVQLDAAQVRSEKFIQVTAMAFRVKDAAAAFPQAQTATMDVKPSANPEFAELLRAGTNAVGPMPADRWAHEQYFDETGDRGEFVRQMDVFTWPKTGKACLT